MPTTTKTFDLGQVPRIEPRDVRQRQERGAPVLILDVRRHPDDQHIQGSVRIEPEDLLRADRIVLPVPQDALIAAYCT